MRRICLANPLWPLSRIPAQVSGGPRVPKRALPESRAGLRAAADRHDMPGVRLSQSECLGCGVGGSGAACGADGAYRCRPGGTGNHVDVPARWLGRAGG